MYARTGIGPGRQRYSRGEREDAARRTLFRGTDEAAYAWVESGGTELVSGDGPSEARGRAESGDESLGRLESDSVAFVPAAVGVLMIVVGLVGGRQHGSASAEEGSRLDPRLGATGLALGVIGPGIAIWEASHPGEAVGVLFLATLLSSAMVATFVAVTVRRHEAHRRARGSPFVIAGVVVAVGFVSFALLQGLDPMVQDPEHFEVMDLAPSDTTPFAILLAAPLVLVSVGLLLDRRLTGERPADSQTTTYGGPSDMVQP